MEDAGADGGGVGNRVSDVFAVFQPNLPRSSVKGPLGRVFEFMFSVLRKESSADLTVPENIIHDDSGPRLQGGHLNNFNPLHRLVWHRGCC